eukprot:CAMPEP_0119329846 /NCGR_PEP_ID=MMETSP1333-20130426/76849_1 /TAXON_ID=418940 /ORGANISM="Scyphosphaera apsteinii, Strain RCC1455" /LENGTH=971 /DNA_ID=CAMNT_0007339073 /DNA_START=48 /DNA_END=2963 /DNA_ORIENTATION=+
MGVRGLWVQFTPFFVDSLKEHRHIVASFWGVIVILGLHFGPIALENITSDIRVITSGTDTYMQESLRAADELLEMFPRLASEKALIRLSRDDKGFVVNDQAATFVESIQESVSNFRPEGLLLGVSSIYDYWKPTWAFSEPPGFIKDLFIINQGSAMIITITLNMSYTDQLEYVSDAVKAMVTHAETQLLSPVRMTATVGGDLMMRQDLSVAVQADIAIVHSLTLPIAMAMLAVFFRSIKIMLVPAITITLSLITATLIAYTVSLFMPLHYLVPGLVASITMACSVDYSLFFLARLKDEVADKQTPILKAIKISTENAGYTVMTSGLGLSLGFVSLCLFPIDAMVCAGISCAASIMAIVFINLTVIPTMICTWPQFFEKSWTKGDCFNGWQLPSIIRPEVAGDEKEPAHDVNGNNGHFNPPEPLKNTMSQSEPREILWWDAFGWWVIKQKYLIIIGGCVLALVVCPATLSTVYTSSPQVIFPNGYPSMNFARELIDSYGEGMIWPTLLLLKSKEGSVLSDDFFRASERLLRRVNETMSNAEVQSVIGLMYLDGGYTRWSDLEVMVDFANGDCGAKERSVLRNQMASSITDTAHVAAELASTAGNAIQGVLSGPTPNGVPQEDQVAKLAGAFGALLGQAARKGSDSIQHARAHPADAIEPGVRGISKSVGDVASSLQREIVLGAKATGALCLDIEAMISQYVYDNRSTVVLISMLHPFGNEMESWLREFYAGSIVASDFPEITFSISGFGPNYLSMQMYTLSWFLSVIFITGSAISVVLFLSYSSVVIAIRSALTNLFSISFVFGVLSLIYSDTVGVTWLVPIVTFSILIGLNMDYDVFLITGILEAKTAGLSTDEAIVKGMVVNGNVIGVAGVIMATAFGGLLFSSTVLNQQLALVIIIDVLFDTVFIQSMFVPAIMAVLGEKNWWPLTIASKPRNKESNGEGDRDPLHTGPRSDGPASASPAYIGSDTRHV